MQLHSHRVLLPEPDWTAPLRLETFNQQPYCGRQLCWQQRGGLDDSRAAISRRVVACMGPGGEEAMYQVSPRINFPCTL
jgi:hypothetical protein